MSQIPPAPRYRSAAANANLLRTALWLSALVAVARAIVLFGFGAVRSRPDLLSARAVSALLQAADALSVGMLVAAVITWLLWVAWTSRLERNAAALGVGEGSVGPRGALLWWLVPGFNLLVPFGQLLGLDRRLADGEQRSHDALIATWWVVLLVSAAAVIATSVPLVTGGMSGASAATLVNAGFASVAWIAAGLISLRVVRQVQRDEDRRTAIVSGGWRPGAPSWPAAPAAPAAAAVAAWAPVPASRAAAAARAAAPAARAAAPARTATGFSPGVPTGPGAVPGWPTSAPRPGSAPSPGTAPRGWSSPGGVLTDGQRRAVSRVPGVVVGLLLVGGLIGLIANAVGSSNGSRVPPGIPTAGPSIAATARVRPTATPARTPAPTPTVRPTGQRPTPTAAAGSPTPRRSGEPPSANTAVLLQHATTGDGSCTAVPSSAWPTGSIAAIACRPANPAVATLRYALYASPDEAETEYQVDLAEAGVDAGTGDCFEADPGESSYTTDDVARGRVYCLLAGDGTPTLAWFDRTLAIVGWATGTGTELTPLCNWWIDESGPA